MISLREITDEKINRLGCGLMTSKSCFVHNIHHRSRVDEMVDMRCLERRGKSRAGSIPVPGTIKNEQPSSSWKGSSKAFLFSEQDKLMDLAFKVNVKSMAPKAEK